MLRKKADSVVISLDISSDSIKMLKGIKKEGRICLLDFACRKYSASEFTPNLVSQYIAEFLNRAVDTKKARIHSTISGRKLCVRVVRLPVMPKEEISQAIRSEIRKYVSPDIERLAFNFFVLGQSQEKGIKKMEVLFTAIQKGIFDEYLQYFKLAGIEPTIVTSACFSGWNLVREVGLDKGATSLMLIDIESQETNLTAYREGKFVFTRNVSIGERDFMADVLFKEVELTIHHYYQITHGERIDKCIILGEGSAIAGLVDFLKQKLEMPVEALHIPEVKLEFLIDKTEEFRKSLPLYTQALGALLVGPGDINLVTQTKTQAKKFMHPLKFPALSKMTAVAMIVFISLGFVIFTFLKGINFYYQHRIKSYHLRQDKLQSQIMQLVQIKRKTDILKFSKELYLRLFKERPVYPVIIAEICKAVPRESIVLDELRFYSDQKSARPQEALSPIRFSIVGRLLEKDAIGSEITRFVLALEESDYFENISVTIRGGTLPTGEQRIESGFFINGTVKLKD